MKNFNWWAVNGAGCWALSAAAALALVGCGSSSSDSGNSSVRVANATLTHPSLDLLVNGGVAASATTADNVSAYTGPASGVTTLQINDAGSATALATIAPTLSGGLHYTLVAYESGGAVKTAVLNEDYAAPTANAAQIRVYNAAPDAGKLDVYITDNAVTSLAGKSPTTSFTNGIVPASSALITESVGSYKVWITGYSNAADLRIVVPNVTLAALQIATVIVTPASGGVLLNGSTLIQQGAYAATRNTNARVRLASAVSGAANVAASAGGVTIDAGSAAPSFGYYALVPASSTLNVSVNGNSVGAPATRLTAGADSTLLVTGSAGAPAASLLADDNRPPSDLTTVKLRLINGITGNVGALTLTANNALVANAVTAGMASSYASVIGSANATNLTLTSSLAPGNLLTNSSNILNAGSVFTIMAAGDIAQLVNSVAGPQFLIR